MTLKILGPSSGFQSDQFRTVEYMLGLKDKAFLKYQEDRPEAQAAMQAALDQTGLGEVVRGMPDGLQSRLLTGGLPLTGRQRIRLLVARALVMQPRLLLVDELLDGLDEATLAALADVLMHPSRSWTLVVATRDARVVARLTRVIDMDVTVKEAAHA